MENFRLTSGLGSLTDGSLGPSDFKLSYYPKSNYHGDQHGGDDDDDDGDDIYIMVKSLYVYVCVSRFCFFCLPPAKIII